MLLLVDNAPGHIVPKAGLSNVEVFFLTPNLTSHIQPLDAGIIAAFKRRYRSKQIRKLVEAMDIQRPLKGAINLANAIRIAGESWREVSEMIISNCWKHAGLTWEAEPDILQTANENTEETENLYNRVLAALDEPTTLTFEQFAAFDEGVFTCESHIERTSNEELVEVLDDTIESIEEPNIPTRKQALEAIEPLQVYMEHSTASTGTSIDQLNSLRDVIKKDAQVSQRQATILDFFNL